MELSHGCFDEGNVLLREEVAVAPIVTLPVLRDDLGDRGAALVMRALGDLPGHITRAVPQSSFQETPSRAPKPKRVLGLADPASLTTEQMYNRWRALGDSIGVHVQLNETRVRLVGESVGRAGSVGADG